MSAHQSSSKYFFYDHQGHAFHPVHDGDVCGRAGGGAQIVPRGPASDGRTLSRKQFKIILTKSEIFVEDLGANVTTRVNGVELRPGHKRKILLGDLVEVPGCRLVLTNQTEHIPGYTQDRDSGEIAKKRALAMRSDGEFTTTIRQDQTRTLFLVPKDEYRKVAVKDFVRSHEPLHER
ncbi:MAG: FHA domain-containing protein, partial [Bdellovibrionota bacterium]